MLEHDGLVNYPDPEIVDGQNPLVAVSSQPEVNFCGKPRKSRRQIQIWGI